MILRVLEDFVIKKVLFWYILEISLSYITVPDSRMILKDIGQIRVMFNLFIR